MFQVVTRAAELPEFWDNLAGDNTFLKREMLQNLERLNPCDQTYHFHQEKGIALVSYKLKLNIFTFSKKVSFKAPVNIIGIPLSVAKPGYSLGDQNHLDQLCQYIKSLKGFYVILNTQDPLALARGYTLPSCKMALRWESLEDYLKSMRSHYRYRLKKARAKFSSIEIEEVADNQLFDNDMYDLYLKVYENSEAKLEKLSIDFFKEFPAKIIKFKLGQETVGFVQLVEKGDELGFLMGGFNHRLNKRYDLYLNILLQVVDYGIKKGFKQLDLGQTAEETKLKLGAVQHAKYLYAFHSNPFMNGVINKLLDHFSYQQYPVDHQVFKEAKDENPLSKMSS